MLHLSQADIEYLKPSPDANFVQHPIEYIKSGSKKNTKRAIFYGVDFDEYELEAIEGFKREISLAGIKLNSSHWNDRELLKYLYNTNFSAKKALASLKECLKWRTDVQKLPVTDKTLELLHSGAIYTLGRDNQSRPILVLNLDKMDPKNVDKNEIGIVLTFFLDSIKQYSFIPGKVENLLIIIDATDKEFTSFPFEKLEFILKKMTACYPTILEKVYMLNASNSFKTMWGLIQGLFDSESIDKVNFLSTTQFQQLQDNIPGSQLEVKYGGLLPNLTTFWPLSAIATQLRPYGFNKMSLSVSHALSSPLNVTFERHTSTGVTGGSPTYFETSPQHKIFERKTITIPTSVMVSHDRIAKSKDYSDLNAFKFKHPVKSNSISRDNYDFSNDKDLSDLLSGDKIFSGRSSKVSHAGTPQSAGLKVSKDALMHKKSNHSITGSLPPSRDPPYSPYSVLFSTKPVKESTFSGLATTTSPTFPSATTYQASQVSQVSQVSEAKKEIIATETLSTPKSESRPIEEWSKKKYLKTLKDDDDDEYEAKMEFCGLFVSNKSKKKATHHKTASQQVTQVNYSRKAD